MRNGQSFSPDGGMKPSGATFAPLAGASGERSLMKHPFPIRHSVPAVLLAFGLLQVAISTWDAGHASRHELEIESRQHIQAMGRNLVHRLEQIYERGEPATADREMASNATEPHLRLGLVLDETDRVLASVQGGDSPVQPGSLTNAPLPEAFVLLASVREDVVGRFQSSEDGHTLMAAFPFHLGDRLDPGGAPMRGVLYLEHDLRKQQQARMIKGLQRATLMGGIVLLLTFLIARYLERVLTRRAAGLVATTHEMATGDLSRRSALRGSDELAQLGESVNQLAITVEERTAEVRASEERLQRVLQHSGTGLWDRDLRTNEVYFSPEWKAQLGYADHELPNRFEEWETRLHPEDHDRALAVTRTLIENPAGEFENEFRLRHRNGSYRWILSRGGALTDEQGAAVRVFGLHLDVTERRETQEALRLSEERFSKVFQAAPIAEAITELSTGRVLDVNTAFLVQSGYAREEVLGRTIPDLGLYADPGQREEILQAIQAGTTVSGMEGQFRRRSGEVRTVLYSGEPIDLDGRRCVLGLLQDITERKEAGEALRSSQERFERLVAQLNDVVWTASFDGSRSRDVNNSIERVYGVTAEQISANPRWWTDVVHPEDRVIAEDSGRRLYETGHAYAEYRIVRPDGEVRWLADRKTLIYDAQEQPVEMGGIATDITARKQAEFELQGLNRSLRMISVCNQKLVQVQTEEELLREICDTIAQMGGYRMAWVGYAMQDASHTVLPVAQAGFEAGYLDSVEITWADNARGQGPTGRAIRTGQPAVAQDILNDPAMTPWREAALERGYAASIALPLKIEERVIGALMVYAAEPLRFDAGELRLLTELADDLAYGIQSLRTREERDRTTAALRQREEQFRTLYENAGIGIYRTTPAGRILLANPAAVEMLGYDSFEELAERNLEERGFGASSVRAEFCQRVETEEDLSGFESVWLKRDGSMIHVRESARAIRDADGQVLYYDGTFADITERKQAEEAMAAMGRRFQSLTEHSADITAVLGEDGSLRYLSSAFEALLGHRIDDWLGQSMFALIWPEDLARTEALFKQSLESPGEVIAWQLRLRHGDGSWRWLEGTGVNFLADPAADGIIVNCRDITRRKLAAEAVERRDRILEATTLAAEQFLKSLDWEEGIQEILEQLGEGAEVDRGYLFQNHLAPDGALVTSQRFEWAGPDIEPQIDNPDLQDLSFGAVGFTRWAEELEQGRLIQGLVREFPEAEREMLTAQQIQSLLVVPVFADSKWWGFIGFDVCRRERQWSPVEISALRTTANTLGSAIDRHRVGAELARHRNHLEDLVEERSAELTRLSRAVEQSPVIVVITNHEARIEYVNPKFTQVTGYAPEEVIGESPRLLNSGVHPPEFFEKLWQTILAGDTWEGEICNRRKDGGLYWEWVRISPLRDAGGAISHFVAVKEDITERKRAVEALRDSETRFRALFNGTRDPVLVHGFTAAGMPSPFVEVNQAACERFGFSREELLQMTPADLDAPETKEHVSELSGKMWAGEGAVFETVALTKDGRRVSLEVSTQVFDLAGSRVALSVARDITERKEAQKMLEQLNTELEARVHQRTEELQTRETHLRAILDSTAEGILVVGNKGNVINSNPRFAELWRIPAELLGQERDDLLLEHVLGQLEEPEAFLREVQRLYGSGKEGWDTLRFKDGRVFERFSRPLVLEGQRHGRLWCFRDVTERQRAEAEKGELRTQLAQAQKLESVGRLAGGVAHDFNNLLTATLHHVDLCRDGLQADHPVRHYLDEITEDAERSTGMVRQLLAFARKQIITPQVLDLNETVANMLKLLRRLIGENIELSWTPGANPWPVKVDPGQVDQLLVNLCVNARDAIGGTGRLSIRTANASVEKRQRAKGFQPRPGDYVQLSVSDDGCGMDEETLDHLFEPFYTTKGIGRGTGLGLATVYGIVQQNGGFIGVRSQPGEGTSFEVHLPRTTEKAVTEQKPQSRAEGREGSETILLVEDEKSLRTTCRIFLEKMGYTVLAAASPEEALPLISPHEGKIDLVLTDVVMPEMNGRDLAEKLREVIPDLRCLFMSGYTADIVADAGVLEAGTHFLQKPFSRDDLGRKVREVLDGV